ncbi:Unknown protein sequence [Pseudomonas syringae pv. syringae]|nr:Unknown protein sequence [Pseudomonas syringae pv. aceris]KPB15711.1 Unknown protein sequence [Pseudomonas syringae pv. syringae]KPB28157.1 Unknown protein sequence [Pseudomonas amygdali pv. sesami]
MVDGSMTSLSMGNLTQALLTSFSVMNLFMHPERYKVLNTE